MTLYQLSELTEGCPAPLNIHASTVKQAIAAHNVLVVLDDDPTGTQSVAHLPVLTRWEQEDFAWALAQDTPAIYVMTTRGHSTQIKQQPSMSPSQRQPMPPPKLRGNAPSLSLVVTPLSEVISLWNRTRLPESSKSMKDR